MRKRIAVFMSELIAEYQETVLKTIFAEANGLGYDVFVFSGYGSYDNNVLYAEGERNLIKIPDLKTFDGIIVGDDTFDIYGMDQELSEMLQEQAECPVVYIRNDNVHFNSITFDDHETMAEMTRYFIHERGVTDLCFMSGPLDMTDAVFRQQGFMEAMSEAGLVVYDRMLFEGDYWRLKGKEAVDHFMQGRDTFPRGVICSNDQMALSVIVELEKRGARIPEDVYVSGYDNSEEGKAYKPGLTSIQVSHEEMSKMAVHMIDDILNGKEVEGKVTIKGTPVYRRSTDESIRNMEYDVSPLLQEINSRYDLAKKVIDISANCANALDMNDIFRSADRFFPNNNAEVGYICLCDESEKFRDTELNKAFSDKMILWGTFYKDRSNESVHSSIRFDRKDILPPMVVGDEPEPTSYIIFPLHYLNKEFGYMVMKYAKDEWVNLLTSAYMQSIADAMEDIDNKRALAGMEELRRLYVEDPLTGLYNRRGFEQNLQQLYEMAKQRGDYMSIVSIDMDGLKYINDTFGHSEGDAALTKMAQIMKGLVGGREICARLGGDEFCIVLYSDTRKRHEQFSRVFHNIVEAENQKWGKPYKLHASIGMFCINDDDKLPLIACLRIADKKMYEAKKQYKKKLGETPR